MRDRDPERYYAALNVSPTASFEEIKLSYEFLKRAHQSGQRVANIGRIQAAFDTLSNAKSRSRYDKGEDDSSGMSRTQLLAAIKTALGSTVTLVVVSVVLVGFLALTLAPGLVSSMRSFSPGDELVWKETGQPVGRVLAFESEHEFPTGVRTDGYRIQPETGDPIWMPAGDLQRHSKLRS